MEQGKTINIMEEDWRYLIILDACRFDTFQQVNGIPGELYKVRSKGSNTQEWLRANFKKEYPNLFYISSNPFASKIWFSTNLKYIPCHFLPVWVLNWDDKLMCVTAEEVSKAVIRNLGHSGRMIIHYLQPHWPFIGKKRIKIDGIVSWDKDIKVWGKGVGIDRMWQGFFAKQTTIEEIKEAYIYNLDYVLFHVEQLIQKLNGKVVVSSDHGTSFGEHGFYAHPAKDVPVLRDVPWLEVKE